MVKKQYVPFLGEQNEDGSLKSRVDILDLYRGFEMAGKADIKERWGITCGQVKTDVPTLLMLYELGENRALERFYRDDWKLYYEGQTEYIPIPEDLNPKRPITLDYVNFSKEKKFILVNHFRIRSDLPSGDDALDLHLFVVGSKQVKKILNLK